MIELDLRVTPWGPQGDADHVKAHHLIVRGTPWPAPEVLICATRNLPTLAERDGLGGPLEPLPCPRAHLYDDELSSAPHDEVKFSALTSPVLSLDLIAFTLKITSAEALSERPYGGAVRSRVR